MDLRDSEAEAGFREVVKDFISEHDESGRRGCGRGD